MIISSHRTSNLNLSAPTSNLMKKHISSNIISESSKTQKEEKVDSIIPKKIEGDYSTYTTKELKSLSYDEVKKNYDEIKKVLEDRLKDAYSSGAAANYFKYTNRGDFLKESILKDGKINFDNENKELSEQIGKVADLFIFQKQLKAVDYYDNNEINKEVFSLYQKYDMQNDPLDLNIMSNFNNEHDHYASSDGIIDIFSIIEDSIKGRKEDIRNYEDMIKKGNYANAETLSIYNSSISKNKSMQIGNKTFDISEINKNDYEKIKVEDEKEDNLDVKKVDNEKIDYSIYTIKQLRQLSYDEVKDNKNKLEKIIDDTLKKANKLDKNKIDDLLAFKSQLNALEYTNDENINETIYNKLRSINDSKVTVWSALAITEKMDDLQKGNLNSIVINNSTIYSDEVNLRQKEDEEENITNKQQDKSQINLDSLINNVSRIASKVSNVSENIYNKELIESYSKFITEYNAVKDSLI
ncbi:hypothetical protein CRV00_04285 [Malaciobacter molluscorum]|uniref:hypothetical protein n=1 Tax=Malaciobacter molluscorum TaxID=1032072 RepID=UPI00100B76C4|nr:hypothetical protein [Malaciobacter molluscorum]RXJ95667.1 hypothetical protein CRV00_04285 [Malaciobacter molluscorum]